MMPREFSPSICCQTGSTAVLLPGAVRNSNNTGQRRAALVETKVDRPPPRPLEAALCRSAVHPCQLAAG